MMTRTDTFSEENKSSIELLLLRFDIELPADCIAGESVLDDLKPRISDMESTLWVSEPYSLSRFLSSSASRALSSISGSSFSKLRQKSTDYGIIVSDNRDLVIDKAVTSQYFNSARDYEELKAPPGDYF